MDRAAWEIGEIGDEEEKLMWNVSRENSLPAPLAAHGCIGQNRSPRELYVALRAQGAGTRKKKTQRNRSASDLQLALNMQRHIFMELLDNRLSKQEALIQRVLEINAYDSFQVSPVQSKERSESATAENDKSPQSMRSFRAPVGSCPSVVSSPRPPIKKPTNLSAEFEEPWHETGSDTDGKIQRFVHGGAFDIFFGAVIFCNCIFLGYRIEYVSSTLNDDETLFSGIVSTIFTIMFTIEFIFRLLADGRRYFYYKNPAFVWNFFDTALVSISLLGLIAKVLESMSSTEGTDFSNIITHGRIMRILRLIRILKIIRMVRIVRFVYSLRIFVLSILETLASLLWALVLLLLLFFCFGSAFTARVSDYLIAAKNSSESFAYVEELKEYWGSLPRSVLTLYMCISGGMDWRDAQHPLHVLGAQWTFLFLVFISFSVFAVLNVVTGFFCQNALATASKSEEVLIYNDYQQHKDTMEKLKHVFSIMDDDRSGVITYDELEAHLEDDFVRVVFEELQVANDDAKSLFHMLAMDDVIRVEDFVMGLMRLRGGAKRIDVYGLSLQLKRLQRDITAINKAKEDKAKRKLAREGFWQSAASAVYVPNKQPSK